MSENGGGDQLARGLPRASFHGPKVSQEVWDAVWREDEPKTDNGNADVQAAGNAGAQLRETESSAASELS